MYSVFVKACISMPLFSSLCLFPSFHRSTIKMRISFGQFTELVNAVARMSLEEIIGSSCTADSILKPTLVFHDALSTQAWVRINDVRI